MVFFKVCKEEETSVKGAKSHLLMVLLKTCATDERSTSHVPMVFCKKRQADLARVRARRIVSTYCVL